VCVGGGANFAMAQMLTRGQRRAAGEAARERGALEALPRGWNQLGAAEKLQHLYGASLEVCWLELSYRGGDAVLLKCRANARKDVMMIAQRWALEGKREEAKREVLEELAKALGSQVEAEDDAVP
jgi:hypothetical protein